MTPVHWTLEARTRLEDVEAYIAQENSTAAKEMVASILARTRQLQTAPLSGRHAKCRTTVKKICANSLNVPTALFIA